MTNRELLVAIQAPFLHALEHGPEAVELRSERADFRLIAAFFAHRETLARGVSSARSSWPESDRSGLSTPLAAVR